MILPATVPSWIQALFPRRAWQFSTQEKILYLTFDDGPHEIITPAVLNMLDRFNAKATFFCIGDNVVRNPLVVENILQKGHALGNHTFHHLNGWKTSNEKYQEDVKRAAEVIPSNLFRPPYGRITQFQSKALLNNGYDLIMWSVLSADYDNRLSKEQCAKRVIDALFPGAILLFHDSEKAAVNMMYALEATLEYAVKNGYRFEKIKKEGSA